MKKILQIIGFILLCEAAGIVGSIFTTSQINGWYMTLLKPALNPPSWVFGPVWITLYVLMGIAMYLVYQQKENPGRKFALGFFTIHLGVNAAWSVVFFGSHMLGAALGVIIVMWILIAFSIYLFSRIRPIAGWILVPYILWVSLASYLNYSIWMLNK